VIEDGLCRLLERLEGRLDHFRRDWRGERLARTASSPDRFVIRPAGEAESAAPDADSGEEVALGVTFEVVWRDISNIPFVYITGSYVPGVD
jgi:hypothetical protein